MYQCSECTQSFELYDSLRRHVGRIHKIHASQSYITYMLDGLAPKCECGCGATPKWRAGSFQRFINGHNSDGKLNPMFGKKHSDESRQGMSKTRKAKFESGETHLWSEGLSIKTSEKLQKMAQKISENTGRAQKISDALIGRTHSAEHNKNSTAAIKKAWENPELRERQRQTRMSMIQKNGWYIISQFETELFGLLESELHTEIQRQHYVKEIKAFYDFYLPEYNIAIEAQGDYWHCKPGTKYEVPLYESQHKNIINDQKKKDWCKNNGVTLLFIWESDFQENPQKVIQTLLNAIK